MTDDAPRWELLPDEPEAFFGLDEGYDRKTLKRAYNALIRRFKPERFPQEFQRIRAAFEELDEALRYGESPRHTERLDSTTFEWDASGATPPDVDHEPPCPDVRRSRTPEPEPRAPSLPERLLAESPGDLHAELSRAPEKTPFAYYALALLADVVTPDDPLAFARHLIDGLRDHANEPGLFVLLHAYCRQPQAPADARWLAETLAEVVPEGRYYYLTESLWDGLARDLPFDEFTALLGRCESRQQGLQILGRLTFYLYLLPRVMWRADEAWLVQALAFVDEHYMELPGIFEDELMWIELVRDYLQKRESFLNGDSLRQRIDEVIRARCEQPEADADREFLQLQVEITANGDAALAAFPLDGTSYNYVLVLWYWLAADVTERTGPVQTDAALETGRLSEQVHGLMVKIETATDSSFVGSLWMLLSFAYLGVLTVGGIVVLLGCVAVIVAALWMIDATDPRSSTDPFVTVGLSLVVGLPVSVAYLRVVKPRWIEPLRNRLSVRIGYRVYSSLWRRRFLEFLTATHVADEELAQHIEAIRTPGITNAQFAAAFLRQDFGMAFFSVAQRFMS